MENRIKNEIKEMNYKELLEIRQIINEEINKRNIEKR